MHDENDVRRNVLKTNHRWLSFHDDLTTLPVDIFEGLNNVVDMDLSYNGLQTLPVGAFSGLSGLLKL